MESRRRSRANSPARVSEGDARRRDAEQARKIALPVGVALLVLAVVLLFVVNTAWPIALAVAVVDAVFLGLVVWHYSREL